MLFWTLPIYRPGPTRGAKTLSGGPGPLAPRWLRPWEAQSQCHLSVRSTGSFDELAVGSSSTRSQLQPRAVRPPDGGRRKDPSCGHARGDGDGEREGEQRLASLASYGCCCGACALATWLDIWRDGCDGRRLSLMRWSTWNAGQMSSSRIVAVKEEESEGRGVRSAALNHMHEVPPLCHSSSAIY